MRLARTLVRALTVATAFAAAGAGAQENFGQNQVQYDRFNWRVLETEHFLVHYYPEIREASVDAARMAERSYARLSRIFNHQFREKKPIVLFGSRGDFAQNNVTGDLGEGTGGVTEGLRHRVLLPLTGDYRSFEHVLQHELVHSFQYDIFARGRSGAGLQNLAQVNPPLWYMEGMAEYLYYGGRHTLTDTYIRDAALNGNLPTIEQMTQRPDRFFPYRFGEALFQYIGARWGDEAIGEIMRSVPSVGVERAFKRELGLSLDDLSDEWREAMQTKHLPQVAERDRPRKFAQALLNEKRTGGGLYAAPALSPDGKYIAFISWGSFLRGEVFPDLWLGDANTGKRIARLVKTTTNPEFEELRLIYSQPSFSPDGRHLAFTAQREGRDVLYILDVRRRKTVKLLETKLEGVLGPSWSPDGERIVFTGLRGGLTDLYVINRDGSGLRQLTNDRFGDLQPQWSPDGKTIAFATDRGGQTNMDRLVFSHWQIATVDLESGQMTVLPGQGGLNINPMWAPDSRSIAYVSDRTGITNIFLYDLGQKEHYQLTNLMGAVSAISEYSPTLTWATKADRIAFTYFDDGDYSVWSVNNPRSLRKQPYREPAGPATVAQAGATPANGQAGPPAADSTPARELDVARERLLDSTGQASLYRTATGFRYSSATPASTIERPDGKGGAPLTVAGLMDSADFVLPDPSTFRDTKYRTTFQPEYIAQPTVGYQQDNFGRGVFGGTTIVFGDLLGNSRLIAAGAINGRIAESQLFGGYTWLGSRLQYSVGISQDPRFLYAGEQNSIDPTTGLIRQTQYLNRFVNRTIYGVAMYPLNRFSRFEFGLQGTTLSQTVLELDRLIDPVRRVASDYLAGRENKLRSHFYAAPLAAYVSDNTLLGYTGPISGRRYRFQAAPSFGDFQWMELMADYRRYDPILFNFLTVATRVASTVRAGRDEGFFPQYIGRPFQVRGYDRENVFNTGCLPELGGSSAGCGAAALVGSRTIFANAELRFPLIRRLDLGILPISLPPLEGLAFYDVGAAWSKGQSINFDRPPASYDLSRDRYLLSSYGFGLRLNLFGLALVRWDYAIPLADRANRKGYWVWTLGPSF